MGFLVAYFTMDLVFQTIEFRDLRVDLGLCFQVFENLLVFFEFIEEVEEIFSFYLIYYAEFFAFGLYLLVFEARNKRLQIVRIIGLNIS